VNSGNGKKRTLVAMHNDSNQELARFGDPPLLAQFEGCRISL
jgi:hypothetical protein